jgi:hypothetical protein
LYVFIKYAVVLETKNNNIRIGFVVYLYVMSVRKRKIELVSKIATERSLRVFEKSNVYTSRVFEKKV